jgi:hypothetical protein
MTEYVSGMELPPAPRGMSLERMPPSALIADWVAVSRVGRGWRENTASRFTEWVSKQELGKQFGHFAGSAEEIEFVRRHMEGICSTAIVLQ